MVLSPFFEVFCLEVLGKNLRLGCGVKTKQGGPFSRPSLFGAAGGGKSTVTV